MKYLAGVIIMTLALGNAWGQYALGVHEKQLNAGVGFSGWGIPVYAGLDFGVHKDISVGGELSFRSYGDHWAGHSYHHSIIGISADGNYHFNYLLKIPKTWDLYAGLNLGFYIWNSDSDYHGDNASGLGLGAQVGGRYYINDRFALNLELGGANVGSGGKFGITFKF